MESAAKPNVGLHAALEGGPKRADLGFWRSATLSAEHHARYWWAAQAAAGLRILDAGCGDGSGAEILARAGAEEVVGVDIAREAVSTAMERLEPVATFTLGDLTALPFDAESFDLVVAFEVIEHVGDQPRALEELRRVLRPDGTLLVSARNNSVSAGTNARPLTSCELSEQLSRQFGHVRMLQQSGWFMSAVMEPCSAEVSRTLPVELRKESDLSMDSESPVVALASNAALAELPLGVGVACSPGGPEEQLRQNILLQLELERAFSREEALRREHDALGERLWETAESNQLELASAAAELDRARRTVVEMQASFSWRLTRPLRGFKGLLRRRS